MILSILKRLRSLLLPGGLLLLAAVAFLRWASPEMVATISRGYPYVVFGAGILLGWRFNRSGVVFALLVVALADSALSRYASEALVESGRGQLVFSAVALLLPANLAVFSLWKERGSLLSRGILGLSIIGVQVLLVVWLDLLGAERVAGVLSYAFVQGRLLDWTRVGQSALLAFFLALLLQLVRFFIGRGRRATDHGLLWSLPAGFLAMHQGSGNDAATLYLAAAGLILAVSVVEASFRLAYRDDLTGLPARRAFEEALSQLSEEERYAVAMVDVDHFKRFNDSYGHEVGDQVLRMVASILEQVTGGGRAFRYGGEEFALLFPGKAAREALPSVEAVRKSIASAVFVVRGPERSRGNPRKPAALDEPRVELSVTVSVGLAESTRRRKNSADVIQQADKALYRAKKAGRNQVRE